MQYCRRMCTGAPAVRVGHVPLGMIDYLSAWHIQRSFREAFNSGTLPHMLLSLQHGHVYTLGFGAQASDLLFDPAAPDAPAPVHRVERGGKVTYHGPGQLVMYPLLDLRAFKQDLHWYVRGIEDVIIRTCGDFGIVAERSKGYPGVWVGDAKIAQVGMTCSQWRTAHGFALNVNPQLSYFDYIVPCGIRDKAVCSMQSLLGRRIDEDDVTVSLMRHFSDVFHAQLVPATLTAAGGCDAVIT